MKILADASLPNVQQYFDKGFEITLYYSNDQAPNLIKDHTILLCRSTMQVNEYLLANSGIQCVATASSGIDHIDTNYLSKHKITLFDAKGSNARAVADYVTACLAWLTQRDLIHNNRAGIIGAGEVGMRVVARLHAAGFETVCFDPPKAQHDNHFKSCTLAELMDCDLLCIHANLHETSPYPSKHLLDSAFFSGLKKPTTIINASRGGIINEAALLNAKIPITYCTDVYSNEPDINKEIIDFALICTPHIAGHSRDAKQNAIIQTSEQIHHHYGVTMPSNTSAQVAPRKTIQAESHWQNTILTLYNPIKETQGLKEAFDKKQAFVLERERHKNRHDFIVFNAERCDLQTKLLLGHPESL